MTAPTNGSTTTSAIQPTVAPVGRWRLTTSTIVSTTITTSMQTTTTPMNVTAPSPLFDGPDRRPRTGRRQRRPPVSRWACPHVGRALLGCADDHDGPAHVVQQAL